MLTVKQLGAVGAALAVAGICQAQEVGRVVSTQPVVQQVAVPQRVCSNQLIEVQPPKSGGGAVMGAIAGGAIGNQVGRGAGNAAATMIGIMGGAILGDRIEGSPPTQMQSVQNCTTQSVVENRTVGYNVVYEYAGKQYSVRLQNDPGPTIPLQVSPVGAQVQAPQNDVVAAQPVYQQPRYVVTGPPPVVYAQPVYVQRYYPPVGLNLGFGYWGGDRHHGHWR